MKFLEESIDLKMLDSIVTVFYDKVLNDEKVSHFFKNIDMSRQEASFKLFLAYALYGKITYQGKFMKAVHADLNITVDQFNCVEMHMMDSLTLCKVPEDLVIGFSKMVASVKGHIISHS